MVFALVAIFIVAIGGSIWLGCKYPSNGRYRQRSMIDTSALQTQYLREIRDMNKSDWSGMNPNRDWRDGK